MQRREELSGLRQQVSWTVCRRALLERGLFQGQGMESAPLVLQRRRCGKAGCVCRGGQGHGPYLYRVKVSGSRRRLEYVPGPEVAAARRARQAYDDHQRNLDEYTKLNREIERLFTAMAGAVCVQGGNN